MQKKPKVIFNYMGGYYQMIVYLVENATENQNKWEAMQNKHIFDNELNGVIKDLKHDGFIIKINR